MIIANFYQQTLAQQQAGPAPYAEFFLYVADIQGFGIDWNGWLANHWLPGRNNAVNDVRRPTVPNGYEYLCTQAGQSGGYEPPWVGSPGVGTTDGSAAWACQAISNASLSTTVSSLVWSAQAPIITSNPNQNGNIGSVVANTAACIAGTDYMLVCVITGVDGTNKTGKFKLKVR